jgi:hypothetical protein
MRAALARSSGCVPAPLELFAARCERFVGQHVAAANAQPLGDVVVTRPVLDRVRYRSAY